MRSVDVNVPLNTVLSPATPDEIFHVDIHLDPTSQEVALWVEIKEVFGNVLQVRNKKKVVPALRAQDLRPYVKSLPRLLLVVSHGP